MTIIDAAGLMTLDQVAAEMGVGVKTVGRWCRAGDLKAEKVFGQWVIEPSNLEAYRTMRKERQANRVHGPSPTVIGKPKRARRKALNKDRANMRRIHKRADEMVAARQEAIKKRFPDGASYQEVYEYVLYNMPPKGLRSMKITSIRPFDPSTKLRASKLGTKEEKER